MDLKLHGIHQRNTIPLEKLGYVALISINNDKWVIVKLKNHTTWEFPGGGIEQGEKPLEAAKREMYEDTGTINANYTEIVEYTVICEGLFSYEKLYYVEIKELGPLLDSEIERIDFTTEFPYENTRYPNVQPQIFKYASEKINKIINTSGNNG